MNFFVNYLCWKRKDNSAKVNVPCLQTLFFWLGHWTSPSSEAVTRLHARNAKEHSGCSLAASKADAEQWRGCSQILLRHWGGSWLPVPPCRRYWLGVRGRWEAGSVPVPHVSRRSWELVSALQMGHFRRAALMGTNCSPQPSSSREQTFRGIWFPVGTYTSFSSGTVGGSDKKNDDAE